MDRVRTGRLGVRIKVGRMVNENAMVRRGTNFSTLKLTVFVSATAGRDVGTSMARLNADRESETDNLSDLPWQPQTVSLAQARYI